MSESDQTQTVASQPSASQEPTAQAALPRYWQVIVVALVGIAFAAVWLGVYHVLNDAIWSSSLLTTHRWLVPVAVVVFSLLVGLTIKYLRAPTVIDGSPVKDLIVSDVAMVDYTTFPGTLLTSFLSVLSGASIGPEAPLASLTQEIAGFVFQKLKLARQTWTGFQGAALASMYNGLIGSPLFAGVLVSEFSVGGRSGLMYLGWNLLAGVIGYLVFTLLGLHTFAAFIAFKPISGITLPYVLYAIVLSLVGCLVAILIGVLLQIFGRVIPRLFEGRVVLRILAAGAITGVIGYFVPQVLFAGQTQVFPMIHNPASYGVLGLLGLGILKLVLLALSTKSGYLGGPTFPTLFACTMFGLAGNLLFPSVPVSLCVLCIEAGALTLATGAPLAMILLVAVVGTADMYTIGLLTLSSTLALIVAVQLKALQARRRTARARATPPSPDATSIAGDTAGAPA
jgi:H+/Cl- antiporter ClcA